MTNILSHWNGFVRRKRALPLSSGELALYYTLLELCNELGRPEWFCAAAGVLQGASGLSRSAFFRARAGLCEKGYLAYRENSGRRAGHCHLPDLSGYQCGQRAEKPKTEPGLGRNLGPLKKEKEKEHALAGILKTEAWRAYADMRRQIQKPLTERATKVALDKLQALAPGDTAAQMKILDQSTFYCWKDLYPLGRKGAAGAGGPPGAKRAGPGSGRPPGPDMDELAAKSARLRRQPGWMRGG